MRCSVVHLTRSSSSKMVPVRARGRNPRASQNRSHVSEKATEISDPDSASGGGPKEKREEESGRYSFSLTMGEKQMNRVQRELLELKQRGQVKNRADKLKDCKLIRSALSSSLCKSWGRCVFPRLFFHVLPSAQPCFLPPQSRLLSRPPKRRKHFCLQ